MKTFRRGQRVIVQLRKGGFEYIGRYDRKGFDCHYVDFPRWNYGTDQVEQIEVYVKDSQIRSA